MQKIFSICTLVTLIIGCQHAQKNKTAVENVKKENADRAIDHAMDASTNQAPAQKVTTDLSLVELNWADSLLKLYMAFSDQPTVKLARTDNMPEEWVYDNTIRTDSAVYDTYRVGHDVSEPDGTDYRYITDQWVYIDTASRQLYEYSGLDEKLKKWWTPEEVKHLFYPVYELSPKTTAMVINFRASDNQTLLDSIFSRYCPEQNIYNPARLPRGWKVYDTTGLYNLVKCDRMEKEIKKYYDQEFYVYGTKGYAKARINNIAFGVDECITNIFAFCFDNAGLTTIGHPVFCSPKLLDLTYARDYSAIENRISNYLLAGGAFRYDSTKLKVLGNAGKIYFTYYDDFLWGRRSSQSSFEFPGRTVWWIEKRNIAGFGDNHLILTCD